MSMLRETSACFQFICPVTLIKKFYLIKWVSSVVALQDHKNLSMTVKRRKYDKNSKCFKKKI